MRLALAAALLAGAAESQAAPVRYEFSQGQADISLTSGTTTLIQSETLILDGVFATFDDVAVELVDFEFTTEPNQMFTLAQAFGGYDEIVVQGASLTPGVGYATQFGSFDPLDEIFSVTVAPVLTSGIYSAMDSGGVMPPVSNMAISFANTTPLVAKIDLFEQTFILEGITLAVFNVPGESLPAVLKADLYFKGLAVEPVPEPGAALLVLAMLAGLGVIRGSRRGER